MHGLFASIYRMVPSDIHTVHLSITFSCKFLSFGYYCTYNCYPITSIHVSELKMSTGEGQELLP